MSKKAPKRKGALGPRSTYTKAKGRAVCKLLADGWTLNQACQQLGLAGRTVRRWALDNDDFAPQYARARELGYQAMADELIEISDDGRNDWMSILGKNGQAIDVPNKEVIDRSKLRVDTRKWLLSKALPKIYGDKLDVNAKHDASESFKALWTAFSAGGLPA
jgi:hypothetical protein